MIPRASAAYRLMASPLLHFLVIGAAIFAIYESVDSRVAEVPNQISIDEYELRRLAALWQAQWRRPPTREELSQLVDDRVREEIFFRKALDLGLDENDVLVRRRLSQKLESALSNVAAPPTFSDDELYEHYENNRSVYKSTVQITLEHRFYSTDSIGFMDQANAAVASNGAIDDDPFHAPKRLERQSQERLSRVFGNGFAEAIVDQLRSGVERGQWMGPIRSAFGLHAVKVLEYVPAETVPFADVRERVAEDLRRDYVARATEERFQKMLSSYQVNVAPLSAVRNLIAE